MQLACVLGTSAGTMFHVLLLWSLLPNVVVESACPLLTCGAAPSGDNSTYGVEFQSGHFTCSSCDSTSCPGCAVFCDLTSCQGAFTLQECLCHFPPDAAAASGEGSGMETVQCDEHCAIGACAADGLICEPFVAACQPWWSCGGPPPGDSIALLQSNSRTTTGKRALRGVGGGSKAQRIDHHNAALLEQRVQADEMAKAITSATASAGTATTRSISGLQMHHGRYHCTSAALPPKIRDPVTFQDTARGYIVFEGSSCEGSEFSSMCFCWDNFLYLKGEDPLTSSYTCDPECNAGPCEGLHCSSSPPPKPAPPPPGPAVTAVMPPERSHQDLMVPIDEINNYDPIPA